MTVSGLAINERCSPRGPRPRQPGPEPTVGFHKVQPSRARALEHLQLMAQSKYLEVKRGSRHRQASERQQHRNQHGHHREESLSTAAEKFNGVNAYGVFSSQDVPARRATRPDVIALLRDA
jgi:hypothetical protein